MQPTPENNTVRPGSELSCGHKTFDRGHSHLGERGNWNLVLPLSGSCRLTINGERTELLVGTIYLIAPGTVRRFHVPVEWECRWLHFNMDAHIQIRPEWQQLIPDLYAVSMEKNDFDVQLRLFEEISAVCSLRRQGWYLLAYCLVQEVILRGNMSRYSALGDKLEPAAKLLDYLAPQQTMEKIARKCAMSRTGFFTKFKDSFGTTPARYREQLLLAQVQAHLENTDLSVKEIARILNITHPGYLSARFKKEFGISPASYRRRFRHTSPSGGR